MEIVGYSERGLVNSLCYELKYAQNNLGLLDDLLSLVSFPYRKVNFKISEAKILIEQSFSDFGDADLVLLVKNGETKQIIFVEAKVKTSQPCYWSIAKEFDKFKGWIRNGNINSPNKSSSNLFVQLYHKVRFISELKYSGGKQLQIGINYPKCFKKSIRKIGNNKVVLNAVNECLAYSKEAFFVALVPDDPKNLKDFYNNTLRCYKPGGFQGWDIENWGYISWRQVEDYCANYRFKETSENFAWNKGQIY